MAEEFDTEALENILAFYDKKPEELIPILQESQGLYGYLPEQAMKLIAKFLDVSVGKVYSVASFYNQFRLIPLGRTMVTVCRGTACHIRGAPQILEEIGNKLGLKEGETSADLEYTVETVACLGCCALAPAVKVKNRIHGQCTREKVKELF